ncbi:hypothetical protein [Trebonia sp.]|uniref:hypothetical protein n=1 Tax=Trebonia sp. TaxID=2767075 RepID=UPI0026237F60|nr:hypothetical protein [Trebonia sp.]
MQQAVCPRCGSSADVRTIGELFDMMNSARDNAMQARQSRQQGPYPGPGQGSGPGYTFAGTGYSDYGQNDQYQHRQQYENARGGDFGQDIANDVMGSALGFLGKAIGRRMQQAMETRMTQAQQHSEQSRAEQAAIVERHPDLRSCLRDKVVFLEGGSRVVPVSEIRSPVTMAQADALVDRLRAP